MKTLNLEIRNGEYFLSGVFFELYKCNTIIYDITKPIIVGKLKYNKYTTTTLRQCIQKCKLGLLLGCCSVIVDNVIPKEFFDLVEKYPELGKLVENYNENKSIDIPLSKVSHYVTDIKFDKKTQCLMGELKILNTPYGKLLKILIDNNFITKFEINNNHYGYFVEYDKNLIITEFVSFNIVLDYCKDRPKYIWEQ
jgi:hypothetical protein